MSYKNILYFLVIIIVTGCNSLQKSVTWDLKHNNINNVTISKLEKLTSDKNYLLDAYHELGNIYETNSKFKNLELANKYYSKYVENYPTYKTKKSYPDKLINEKIKNIKQQIDLNNYTNCIKQNTLKGYKNFLDSYPNSTYVNSIKKAAYKKACSVDSVKTYKQYISRL